MGRGDFMVVGENVLIRPVEQQDLPLILNWSRLYDLQQLFSFTTDFTHYDDIKNQLNTGNPKSFPDSFYFSVVEKDEKNTIGGCMLTEIDYANKNCLCSLYIGDEKMRSKGFGIEGVNLLLEFAFNRIDMNRVGCWVSDFNKHALKSFKKCGFKVEGIMREGAYRSGRYYDVYYMGILKSEYTGLKKGGSEGCSEASM